MQSTKSHRGIWSGVRLAALIGAWVWSAGCTSSEQYRRSLDERDGEIRALREERAQLKREREVHLGEIDALAVQLREASARPAQPAPVQAAARTHPGLDELGIGYGTRGGMTVISIPASITFASGQAELSAKGKAALRQVAAVLKDSHPGRVYSIEGHTDADPIRKSKFTSNRELSLARAMAVLTFLVEECRIPDEQCVLVGHGQYRAIDTGSSAAAKAKNRRVEIVVHAPAS